MVIAIITCFVFSIFISVLCTVLILTSINVTIWCYYKLISHLPVRTRSCNRKVSNDGIIPTHKVSERERERELRYSYRSQPSILE